jgi:hypothetical protein
MSCTVECEHPRTHADLCEPRGELFGAKRAFCVPRGASTGVGKRPAKKHTNSEGERRGARPRTPQDTLYPVDPAERAAHPPRVRKREPSEALGTLETDAFSVLSSAVRTPFSNRRAHTEEHHTTGCRSPRGLARWLHRSLERINTPKIPTKTSDASRFLQNQRLPEPSV